MFLGIVVFSFVFLANACSDGLFAVLHLTFERVAKLIICSDMEVRLNFFSGDFS